MRCHNHRMDRGDSHFIWQRADWPAMRYDLAALAGSLAEVSCVQGRLLGRLADVGMPLRDQACLAALTEDVVKTCGTLSHRLQWPDPHPYRRVA